MDQLLRSDCPAYNNAIRQAFIDDPRLEQDTARATALAAGLYEQLNTVFAAPPADLLRGELLQKLVTEFEALPWMHQSGEELWWGINAVMDIAGLSDRERAVLRIAYESFDYHEDTDIGKASFRVMTTRQDGLPRQGYQNAAARTARHLAESRLINCLMQHKCVLSPTQPTWHVWLDRLIMYTG